MSVNLSQIEEKVRNIIITGNMVNRANEIGPEDLLATFGVNSNMFIKLIVGLEKEFNIEFEDEQLDINKFRTIKNIALFIEEKLKG